MKRLTDEELLELLDQPESDRVERKAHFKGDVSKKARQAVCAFANDVSNHNKPGVLFVGVDDAGTPNQLSITDQLLLALSDMKTDGNILPLPTLTVEKRLLKGSAVAVVTVMPSDMPPVKYDGRIWVRTGPRRAIASAQDERILNEKRRYKTLPFDVHPIPSSQLDDLSRLVFEAEYLPRAFADDILESNDRTYVERLSSCRMIASTDNPTPTVLGMLSLGKSPQDFIPGSYVQFLKLAGKALTDPIIDSEDIRGSIVDVLRRTEEKLKAHNRIEVTVDDNPTHQLASPYPMAALQQILYNAALHRSYESTNSPIRVSWFEDRIEILSPGGPYGCVTTENFGKPGVTDYRNPNIADVLKTFGFVQSFGRGIAIAKQVMNANGNPEPEFQVNASAIICVLRGQP